MTVTNLEFERLIDPPKTRSERGTYRFDLAEAGCWTVTVDDGKVSVARGRGRRADSVLRMTEDTFARIVRGELSAVSAFLTGALAVTGDLLLVAKLDRFRPVRDRQFRRCDPGAAFLP